MPGGSVLDSWNVTLLPVLTLSAAAFLYIRGSFRANAPGSNVLIFLAGIALLFIALTSPLDSFGHFFLWIHMTQHVLLMMAAPLLIVSSRPLPIIIRGLPQDFAREGVGPFLRWRPLRTAAHWLSRPAIAWLSYAATLIVWHLPRLYQFALASPAWHNLQHACFFWSGVLFWWPVINPGTGTPRWFAIPYLLLADILNTAFSAWLVFSGSILYPLYELNRTGSMRASTDQVIAGAVMWVPGSLFFLLPAIGVAYRLAANPSRAALPQRRVRAHRFVLDLDLRAVRRFARPVMLVIATAAVIEAFAGSRSAASAVWFQWRAVTLLALLAAGNFFCMACPLMLVRDAARRIARPHASWPMALRNKWIATGLFLIYLVTYAKFSLWGRPVATAWIIVGYFIAIILIDCIFTGASFCKYVCPVGQFNFLASCISPREIGLRDRTVCSSCHTHDCVRGNEFSRGCELKLFQPAKLGNLDCTFCLDCVQACPSSNLSLVPVSRLISITSDAPRSGIGRISKRDDVAALAAVFTLGAFVNAGWMLDAGAGLRMFLTAAPVAVMCVCFGANAIVLDAQRAFALLRRSALALTPVGVAMWLAHLLSHAGPMLLSITSIRDLQILALDAGFLMSIAAIWKLTNRLALALPWQLFCVLLYSAGVWLAFQPMRMTITT